MAGAGEKEKPPGVIAAVEVRRVSTRLFSTPILTQEARRNMSGVTMEVVELERGISWVCEAGRAPIGTGLKGGVAVG